MSADNWTTCPNCKKLAEKKKASSYGKVSEKEYLVSLESAKKLHEESTLREDYDLYTDEDGFFSLSYSCSCSVCKFYYEYKYEEKILN